MYKYLLMDKQFRDLNIPLPAAQYKELELKIKKGQRLDPIITWQDHILTGYEQYDLCIKHHKHYFCTEKYFSRKADAIAWLCREQLKRKNLPRPTTCWLLYRLYEALMDNEKHKEAKERFQYKQLSPSNRSEKTKPISTENFALLKQVGDAYGLHKMTIRNYVKFGRQLDALDDMFPGIRVRILKGEVEIAIMYMDALMQMHPEELSRMISDPKCKKLVPPEVITREILQKRHPQLKKKAQVKAAIKETPIYDPDAELNGMTFTISAWIKAITRTGNTADLIHATQTGKERLQHALSELSIQADSLYRILEGSK